MTDFERAAADRDDADAAFKKAMAAILKDFVAAKAELVADPTPENYKAKREAARALRNAREIERKDRPVNHEVGGDFRGDDADCFLPEDQGGDTTKALDLLVTLFAGRGDTASVPADVLDGMRAGIVSTRGDI